MIHLGIDWSENKHDACFLNEAGAEIARLTFAHTVAGLTQFDATRQKLGVTPEECWVGLETAHTLLIDFLWARGYVHIYVIPPASVKSARKRYSQSGAHNDQSDAYVIADMTRTDRARLHPWFPDSLLVRQLREQVGLVVYLNQQLGRTSNRLRAVLLRYYPVALTLFSAEVLPLTAQFVIAYPTPAAARELAWAEFEAFARGHHACQAQRHLMGSFARLQQPQPQADAVTVTAFQGEAVLLAQQFVSFSQAKTLELKAMAETFAQHTDAPLFESLPGTGEFLAPALLAKFGDDRRRFPTPASVQCLAGTCPVTDASGKHRYIKFRTACDHEFRWIVQEWAKASLSQSVWAATYWEALRPHCDSDSHAYRCLGNRWLAVGWKVWQSRQPYDEAYHLQQHAKRSKPRV